MAERTTRAAKTDPGSLVTGLARKLNELDDAVARQAERFAAIIDIGTQISSARDLDELLRAVMDRLTTLVGAEAATLFVHDEPKAELWSRVLKGASLKEIRIPADAGIAGWTFTNGKTLHLGDAYSDVRFNPDIDKKSGFRTRSLISAPLKHLSGRVLGVLEVLDRRIELFTSDDRVLVEGVASQVAAVLDNVLLLEELKARNDTLKHITEELAQRVHDLDVLYGVEQAISSSEARADLLDRILSRAIEVVGAGAGSILLAEEDRGRLFFRSAKGDKTDALRALVLPLGQGVAGHVAVTGLVVRVPEAADCELYDPSIAKKLGLTIKALVAVPIRAEGQTLGALELLNKAGGFTEADERLAVLLAGQVGRALVVQQSREEIQRKGRLASIGQMIAGILHDLRTPVTVVAGFAELMVEERDEEARRDMAKTILAQLDLIGAMQKETLAFVRGEKSLLVRKVYVHAFIDDLEEQLKKEFEPTNITLKVEANYTGLARFDENKLRRAIFNLARNAIDAMAGDGRFVFSVDREGDELVFRAQDNGPGIPEEIAPTLFESFVTAGKKHGTGLGLAIVRRIAQEHGGSVGFKSKPGKGTTFELRIPAGAPAD